MSVALIIVSHSDKIAQGVVDVAAQMGRGVAILPAGGTADGRVGTSFDKVNEAVQQALSQGSDVVILTDLGSATLTAESVVEVVDDDAAVCIVDAPLVEGAVAAAVAAATGGGIKEVAAAARAAGCPQQAAAAVPADAGVTRTCVLINTMGLHARPAAHLATMAAGYDAEVLVNGQDATSVLSLLALTLQQGDQATVSATGPDARRAVDEIAQLIESGFGEE